MSDLNKIVAPDSEEVEQPDGKAKRPLPWFPIGVAASAVIAGSGLGIVLVGPALAGGAEELSPKGAEQEHAKPEHTAPHIGAVVEFDNMIVNPSDSEGLRFLMATVGVGVADEKIAEELHEFELSIRDRITSVLSAQTLGMLTAPGARDSLRILLAEVFAPFLEGESGFEIYIPHFVIQ